MKRNASFALLAGLFAVLAPGSADAEVIIYVYQSGSDVIMSGSGTLDTTDLASPTLASGGGAIAATYAAALTGPTGTNLLQFYNSGITGPASFGSGTGTDASFGSGDEFGAETIGGTSYLLTPRNYVSGTSLSATDTFSSTTLSDLGLTAGQYTFTWGTGGDADSLVINISTAPSVVPEPSSLALCGLAGLIGSAYAWRRRNRAAIA